MGIERGEPPWRAAGRSSRGGMRDQLFIREARSALLDAVALVTAVAILAHAAVSRLEALEVLDGLLRRLGIRGQFRKSSLEVVHMQPDFGSRIGIAAGLGVFRNQVGHLVRRVEHS